MSIPSTSSLLNPTLYLIGDAGTYQDSAKTTPASANGATVRALADQSGNGFDFLNVSGSAPTLATNSQNGRSAILFSSASTTYLDGGNPAGLNLSSGGYTIIAIGVSGTAYGHWLSKGAFGNPPTQRIQFMDDIDNALPFERWRSGVGAYAYHTPTIAAYSYSPSGTNVGTESAEMLDIIGGGIQQLTGSVPPFDSASNWRIGLSSDGQYPFGGPIYALLIYNSVLSSTQLSAIGIVLGNYYGVPQRTANTSTAQVIYAGDSTVFGAGASPFYDALSQSNELLNSTLDAYNVGIPSTYAQQWINTYGARVTSKYSNSFGKNIAIFNCLINTLDSSLGNSTPSQAYSQYQTFGATLKGNGFVTVLCTCTPNALSVGGYPTAANGLLKADFAVSTVHPSIFKPNAGITYADYLLDFASDSLLTDNTNTTYYLDGTHMTSVGYGVVSKYIAAVIGQISGSYSATSPATHIAGTASGNGTLILSLPEMLPKNWARR